ncbi:beta-lactamase-like protein [Xylariomycetidae sp. FL2044]|nr:beta-lactamase-like protein [Xylariomycetidae sp. FL2044]
MWTSSSSSFGGNRFAGDPRVNRLISRSHILSCCFRRTVSIRGLCCSGTAVNLTKYLYEAKKVAGDNLAAHFEHCCIKSGQVYPEFAELAQAEGFVAPNRPFNSLFFVGSAHVSSWAIDTGAGLVLIDTLDSSDEVEQVLLPGLSQFGYSGSHIAAVIVTHEHADHYGGARYLQDNFSTPLYTSEEAWQTMANDTVAPAGLVPPMRDLTLEDGQELTVGNTTIHLVATPGHAPGTMSLLFSRFTAGDPVWICVSKRGGVVNIKSEHELG